MTPPDTGRLLLTLALAAALAPAWAQTTYKCKDERGRIQAFFGSGLHRQQDCAADRG